VVVIVTGNNGLLELLTSAEDHDAHPTDDARPRSTLTALTGARFFAAVAVVIGHYIQRFGAPAAIFPAVFLGAVSVAFFYLLSGYILTYNYGEKSFRWADFFQARVARVYPTYVLGLALGTIAMILEGKRFDLITCVAWVANLLALQNYIPLGKFHQFNSPAWSICCEFFFYALFPMILGFLPRNRSSLFGIAVAAFALEGIIFAAAIAAVPHIMAAAHWQVSMVIAGDFVVYRFPPYRVGEFVIGMALARGFHYSVRVLSGGLCTAIVISGAAAILGVVWLFPVKASFELPLNALFFFWVFIPILGLMLLAMANGRGRLCALLASPPIVLLGEASFAMYILHEPVLRISQSFNVPPAISFLGTLGLSVTCFLWFERPARKALRPHR
jgi:peptidoglycan/LPS O-acetylase OafA/YrhL